MPNSGDVIIVDFPGAQGVKRRPAVVLSTAVYHANRPDVLISLLTSNIVAATTPTDYVLQDWSAAGLKQPSAFRSYLATIDQRDILATAGQLTAKDWQAVQARLNIALAVK